LGFACFGPTGGHSGRLQIEERPGVRYRFADCEIDTATRELRVASAPTHVEPQVVDLLVHLARNPDRLIGRDELVAEIWQGRIVSEAAISSRINAARTAVGDDGTRQAVIRTVPRRGIRMVAAVRADPASGGADAAVPGPPPAEPQTLRFCRGQGGVRLAYAVSGSGPPLVRVGHWLTHLEHDWHSPIWRPILDLLGAEVTVIRYDQRATGLSQREVADLPLDAFVGDLDAVTRAAGLDAFPLYATSQGVPVALAFAARHPERLTRLILHGGYCRGRLVRSAEARAEGEAYLTLMRQGWAQEGSQFLQAFASIFAPDATPDQVRSLVELQRISAERDTAVRLRASFDRMDVRARLPEVAVPTLVMHARNDGVHPLQESLDMAAELADAELRVLESRNHVLLPQDPVWAQAFDSLLGFAKAADRGV
jgi:DNA-binding winged helix-turn-helix (wHTH) protein/pimeloyl-ACP methyl ester carboxylesterase